MIIEFSIAVRMPVDEILGRSRKGRIPEFRQLYWLLLLENGFKLPEISRLCDRDRVTVYMGIKRIKGLLEVDAEIKNYYNQIKHIKR